jgi:hypothetical protein
LALSLPIEVLDRELELLYSKSFEKKTESLRTKVSDSPTQFPSNVDFTRLVIKTRKQKDLIGLIILSWYMPDEIRFILQLQLSEIKWKDLGFDLGSLLLTSKAYTLAWLLEQEFWNESDFFGNVLNKDLARIWTSCDFVRRPTGYVKRYTGYCRGYRDSSRRAPSPLPSELVSKSSVYEETRLEIERQRNLILWVERIERRLRIS